MLTSSPPSVAANLGSHSSAGPNSAAVVTGDLLSFDSSPHTGQSASPKSPFARDSLPLATASQPNYRRNSSVGLTSSASGGRRGSRSASNTSGRAATTAGYCGTVGESGVASGAAGFTSTPFASFVDAHDPAAAMHLPLPLSPTSITSSGGSGSGPIALPPSPPLSASGSGSMTPPSSSSRTNSSSAASTAPVQPSGIASARRRSSTQLDPAPVTVTVPIPLAIPPKLVTAIQLSDEYIAVYTKTADRAQVAGAALTVRVDHDDGDFVITSACPKARKKMHQFLSQELAKILASLPEQPLRRGSGGGGAGGMGFAGGSPRMRPLSILSMHSTHSAASSMGASGVGSGSSPISGGHFLNQRSLSSSATSRTPSVDPAVIAARKRANRMSIMSAWSIPDESDDDTTPLTTAPLVASGAGSSLTAKPTSKPVSRGFFSSTAPIPHAQWISSSPAAASANKASNRNSMLLSSPAEQPLTFADPPFANTAASSRPGFMAPPPPPPPLAMIPALAPPPSAVIAPNRPQGGYVHQVRGGGQRPTSMLGGGGLGMFPPPPPGPQQQQRSFAMSSR